MEHTYFITVRGFNNWDKINVPTWGNRGGMFSSSDFSVLNCLNLPAPQHLIQDLVWWLIKVSKVVCHTMVCHKQLRFQCP